MILEKLKSWSYYESMLPMYFKDSTGTAYHFKILVDLLNTLDEVVSGYEDASGRHPGLFEQLDITDSIEDLHFNVNEATDILDKIGALFGLSRNVHVKDLSSSERFDEDITLNNNEFLSFIKAKIALNAYDGTRENANSIYDKLKLPFYMLNSIDNAEVNFYIDVSSSDELSNIAKLVLSGLMTLESIGITYNYVALDISKLAYWDSGEWDSVSLWGI